MRLFVSVDLPDELAEAVEAIQSDLSEASGLRMTDPTQAHVTLKFLGEVDPSELDRTVRAIAAGVDDADVDPFEVELQGIGAFPSPEYISVVWLGVGAGGEELTRLHEAIEERAVAIEFDPEDHEFTPHVTIARMDHAGGKALVQRRLDETVPEIGRFQATEVRLTESNLGPDGPEYTTVERFEL